jgi:CYTH domain-containing protein
MNIEIERKFLVLNNDFKKEAYQQITIKQGFLNTHKERTVRVRIANNNAFLTIKGKSNRSGTTRFEWEKSIAIQDAEKLLQLCEHTIIEKTRYLVKVANLTFEVDEFTNENNGLIIAEIELTHEDEVFNKPKWLGKEVTGKKKYYNSLLSKKPYHTW